MLDPKTANLQGIFGFSMGLNVSPWAAKKAKNTHLSIPNGLGSLLEKHAFDPFLTHLLTHFWCHEGPLSSNFGIFHGPKRVIKYPNVHSGVASHGVWGAFSMQDEILGPSVMPHHPPPSNTVHEGNKFGGAVAKSSCTPGATVAQRLSFVWRCFVFRANLQMSACLCSTWPRRTSR